MRRGCVLRVYIGKDYKYEERKLRWPPKKTCSKTEKETERDSKPEGKRRNGMIVCTVCTTAKRKKAGSGSKGRPNPQRLARTSVSNIHGVLG